MGFETLQRRLLIRVRNRVQNGELTERGLARMTGISPLSLAGCWLQFLREFGAFWSHKQKQLRRRKRLSHFFGAVSWLRGVDLNHRPLGYEPNELPDCSTPHFDHSVCCIGGQTISVVNLAACSDLVACERAWSPDSDRPTFLDSGGQSGRICDLARNGSQPREAGKHPLRDELLQQPAAAGVRWVSRFADRD